MIDFKNFKGDQSLINDIKKQADITLDSIRGIQCTLVRDFFSNRPRPGCSKISGDLMQRFEAAGNTQKEHHFIYLICDSQKYENPKIIAWGLLILLKGGRTQVGEYSEQFVARYFRQLEARNRTHMEPIRKIIGEANNFNEMHRSLSKLYFAIVEENDSGLNKLKSIVGTLKKIMDIVAGEKKLNFKKAMHKTTKRVPLSSHGLSSVFEIGEPMLRHHYVKKEEHYADQLPQERRYFVMPRSINEQSRAYEQAISIKSQKTIAEISPVCSDKQATLDEIKHVVDVCKNSNDSNAKIILCAIAFGLDPESLLKGKMSRGVLTKYFKLPEHAEKNYKGEQLLQKVKHQLDFIVPPSIVPYLGGLRSKAISVVELNKFIKSNINNSLNINCCSNFFWFWLKRKGHDIAIREIVARENLSLPQSYYTTFNSLTINLIWADFHKEIGLPVEIFPSEGYIGSQLAVKNVYIREFFCFLKEGILTAINQKNIVDSLNSYTLYLYHLLMLCSGHRPGIDVLSNINNFSFATSSIWIHDKSHKGVENPRIVLIPKFVLEQLKDYLAVLKIAEKYFFADQPGLSETINSRLSGKDSLLHWVSSNNVSQPLSSKELYKKLSDVWPIPLNWNRHFLRTYLVKNHVSQPEIDLFMGHQSTPYHLLGKFGGCASSPKSVTNTISIMLKELNISYVPFLKRFQNAL